MTKVLRVNASDRDRGRAGRIVYRLGDEPKSGDFGIFASSGEIYVRRALDRERQAAYSFIVIAEDDGLVSAEIVERPYALRRLVRSFAAFKTSKRDCSHSRPRHKR